MESSTSEIKKNKAVELIKFLLSSPVYPFLTAIVVTVCYYLSLDIVTILYLGITGTLVLLLLDDISPIVNVFLFVNVFISWENSPSSVRGNSDYYLTPQILVPTVTIVAILIGAFIFRFVKVCRNKKFRITPMFFGLVLLAIALLLNGLLNKDYIIYNILFAGVLAFAFLGVYCLVKDNLSGDRACVLRVCYALVALGLTMTVMLAEIYITNENIFVDGIINRSEIRFGWGVYTHYGVFTMCIPAAVYLAYAKKLGFIYTAISFIFVITTVLSCCRHAMVSVAIIYPVSALVLLFKGKYKITNLCILAACLIGTFVFMGIFEEQVIDFFKTVYDNIIVDGKLNGSGRMELFRQALEDFKNFPVFGRGFYKFLGDSKIGFAIPPLNMYHNTVLEMMGSCGAVGLIAYLFHRLQTVICYFRKVTVERTFIVLIILALLISSLLDRHVLAIAPTLTYSLLIAVLVKSGEKPKVES